MRDLEESTWQAEELSAFSLQEPGRWVLRLNYILLSSEQMRQPCLSGIWFLL